MALSFKCPGCRKGYKAPERAAGKTVPCVKCGVAMTIPSPAPIEPAEYLLQDAPGSPYSLHEPEEPPATPPPEPRKKQKPVDVASLPPLTTNDPPFWRRHLHWLLVLALIPLVVSLLAKPDQRSIDERINESLEDVNEHDRDRVVSRLVQADSLDELLSSLPRQRLHGAFLGRASLGHWVMAVFATIGYMAFFMFLAFDGSANPIHVLLVGLFTSTIGIGFLLVVQLLASFTEGHVVYGRSVLVIIFWLLKFIAFSYNAATDPSYGFFVSFLGFTLGVGLCEEFVKALPLFWHRNAETGQTWRSMLIWGLASGAGFGIAEGVMYSSRYYNGVSGPGIYLVRFLSCVALHAIWSGSAAILLYQRRDLFTGLDTWHAWILPTLFVIAVPATLHGLYDTCLKREMNGFALLAGLASFGYLAFLFSRLQTDDDEAANKAMLREYQRRRSSMA